MSLDFDAVAAIFDAARRLKGAEREAEILARLRHPGSAPVFATGTCDRDLRLLSAFGPLGLGQDLRVRDAFDLGVQEIEEAFADAPALGAAVRRTAGRSYVQLGLNAEALPELEALDAVQGRVLPPGSIDRLRTAQGRLDEARSGYPADSNGRGAPRRLGIGGASSRSALTRTRR